MAKNVIVILEGKDVTAQRFAATMQKLGMASEIVVFNQASDATPLADVDGGNVYVLGTLTLATHKIGGYGPLLVADVLIVLGLSRCAYLCLVVCNSGVQNGFHNDRVFVDDVHLELRRASLLAKIDGGPCLRIDRFVGYKGYVGFYDGKTAALDGGKEIAEYLDREKRRTFGAMYIHTEPVTSSPHNEFLTPDEGVVTTMGFNHHSWEIASSTDMST